MEQAIDDFKYDLDWKRATVFTLIHSFAFIAIFVEAPSRNFLLFLVLYGLLSRFGINSGAHRLFSHRTYKANKFLRLLLIYLQSISVENSTYIWTLRHRIHHKLTDTNADPHNSKRGFWFSHCTWVLYKYHPDFIKQSKIIDMSDLKNDSIVMFQHRYYKIMILFFNFLIPIFTGYKIFGDKFWSVFFYNFIRMVISLHSTFMVNSVSHFYGTKPYDKSQSGVESKITNIFSFGEGYHNYHHTFPYDYKTSETKNYWTNINTAFIDFFSWIGCAKDLKFASDEVIKNRVLRTGDGTHKYSKEAKSEIN